MENFHLFHNVKHHKSAAQEFIGTVFGSHPIAISVFTSAKMNCTKGENDAEFNLNRPNTAGVKTP